jgi:histidinol-phosphate/aromatic aminotransferase/cobyric acid decarboxylase-like protein
MAGAARAHRSAETECGNRSTSAPWRRLAAVAALADEDFLARSYALNLRGMQQLTEAFRALGLEYMPSVGNFVLVKGGAGSRRLPRVARARHRPAGG